MQIIDTNAAFGHWPIQYTSAHSLSDLDREYEEQGVGEVWLSAVESILAPEPDRFDELLRARLADFPRFRFVKTINPLLANWRESFEQALEHSNLPAIKLFPNYHGYSLEHPSVAELCDAAAQFGVVVLIQIRVNDERNQPVCLQVNGVSCEEIVALSHRHPAVTFIALSAYIGEVERLAAGSERLLIDLSFLDGANILERVAARISSSRIVFGSAAAWLLVAPAILKLKFTSLPSEEAASIAASNIRKHLLHHV